MRQVVHDWNSDLGTLLIDTSATTPSAWTSLQQTNGRRSKEQQLLFAKPGTTWKVPMNIRQGEADYSLGESLQMTTANITNGEGCRKHKAALMDCGRTPDPPKGHYQKATATPLCPFFSKRRGALRQSASRQASSPHQRAKG